MRAIESKCPTCGGHPVDVAPEFEIPPNGACQVSCAMKHGWIVGYRPTFDGIQTMAIKPRPEAA